MGCLGDFNVSLKVDESTAGPSKITIAMDEFKECIQNIEIGDINQSGYYTPGINVLILKRPFLKSLIEL